jgi:hypothetical protein
VGLVTYADLPELASDDQPLIPALAGHGLRAVPLVWDDPAVDWAAYRLCVVRSTWDYHHRRDAFVAWAERVAPLTALWNPAPVLRWNTDKTYLRDLQARGIPIVPTAWPRPGAPADLAAILAARGWDRVVIKPVVSASAHETELYTRDTVAAGQAHLGRLLGAGQGVMVQQFVPSVVGYGERSLVFIDGALTHAARRPAPLWEGQTVEEDVTPVVPTAEETAFAGAVLRAAGAPILYARVDLVRDEAGALRLLELELTEPSLFLDHAPHAVTRLAAAIAQRVMSDER